jgi:hypothetical protein
MKKWLKVWTQQKVVDCLLILGGVVVFGALVVMIAYTPKGLLTRMQTDEYYFANHSHIQGINEGKPIIVTQSIGGLNVNMEDIVSIEKLGYMFSLTTNDLGLYPWDVKEITRSNIEAQGYKWIKNATQGEINYTNERQQ